MITEPHRSPRILSRALPTLLAVVVLLGLAAPVAAAPPEAVAAVPSGEIIPGEVVVTFRDRRVPDASRLHGLVRIADLGAPETGAPTLLSTNGRPVADVVAELQADPSVLAAEPNYMVHLAVDGGVAAVEVDDPQTGDQYSLDVMRVRQAWSLVDDQSTNLIAVLDTGVMSSHPDLVGRVATGYDFVNDDTNAADDNGHGTWVAGIIAASQNDAYGIAGITPRDKILPVKIMNGSGTGSTADLLTAIRWSADKGADVINMSVGGFPYSQLMQDAVNYAWGKGVVLVGAAGNNRREETYYPASFDNVISVSATQREGEFSNWSSYGPKVDVSAPGSSVLTTNCTSCTYADHDSWGSHTFISGTSFATPNVVGVVSLIQARYPTYTPQQVVDRLYATVDDFGYSGWDKRYGRGRVNAYRAVGGAIAGPSISSGDSLEPNNAVSASGPRLTLGVATRPNLYPAGDVDVFTVDVPRAGRLDVRVAGVVDTRAYPWNKSGLPVDPVVELYTSTGTLIRRVDNVSEGSTELASHTVPGWARIIVRVSNWYPNGNRTAYTITPSFVDTVAPVATISRPTAGAIDVSRFVSPVVTFNERVTGVSSTSIQLRDAASSQLVPATVVYDASRREARLVPKDALRRLHPYRVEVGAAIKDAGGNSVAVKSSAFTTALASFRDTDGTYYETAIEWLVTAGIAGGCSDEAFCPTRRVTREEAAAFVVRAVDPPSTPTDFFTDDDGRLLEGDINRLAGALLTNGCAPSRFCPAAHMTRAQMASFLVRALDPPETGQDFFTDDDRSVHQADINRLAAAGIVAGCSEGRFCPGTSVTREQMAAFLYRAFADGG